MLGNQPPQDRARDGVKGKIRNYTESDSSGGGSTRTPPKSFTGKSVMTPEKSVARSSREIHSFSAPFCCSAFFEAVLGDLFTGALSMTISIFLSVCTVHLFS